MKTKIGIHPAFLLIILIGFFTETLFRMLAVYLCLLIHEAGHISCSAGFGIKPAYIKIMPFGIAMRLSSQKISDRKMLAISAAGPVFSILAGLLFKNEFLKMTNLALGIFNLLPAKTLDGGKIFCILMSQVLGSIKAYNILKKLSLVISLLLLILGAYAFYTTGFNISLVLVSTFLIYSLVSGDDYGRISAHFTALDYRRKRCRRGIYEVKQIAVSQDMPLRHLLSQLPARKLCIINILDTNHRHISTITEQTAVDIMLKHGANASYASAQKGEIK